MNKRCGKIKSLKLLLFFVFIFSIYFVFDSADAGHPAPCAPGEIQIGDFCYACEASTSDTVCPNDFVAGTCTDSNPDYDCVSYTSCIDRKDDVCKVAPQTNGENCQLCPECNGKQALNGNRCRLERSACDYTNVNGDPNYVVGKCGVGCPVPGSSCPGGNTCPAPLIGNCGNVCKGDYTCETNCVPICSSPNEAGLCRDWIDNDLDGNSDYDSIDGRHGDNDCALQVTAVSLSKALILSGSSLDITCTINPGVSNGVNSVFAYLDNDGNNVYNGGDADFLWEADDSWISSTQVVFKNEVVTGSGIKKINCGIYSSQSEPYDRSFQNGGDVSTTVEVLSDNCSQRSKNDCQKIGDCKWVDQCKANSPAYSGYIGGACVSSSQTVTYACSLSQCPAQDQCDGSSPAKDTGIDYCNAGIGDIYNKIEGCNLNTCKFEDGSSPDTSAQDCVDTCTDTDNGKIFDSKGTITDNNLCSLGSTCPVSTSNVDSCNENTLTEYSCNGNDATSTTKNCNDYDNANVDPAQNICGWSDGNCGNGACNVVQSSVDCDAYANGDNVVSSEATLSSCSVGCTNENCCKITKRFFTGCLNDGTQSGKLDVCENGNCVTISTNEQETCSSGGCCYPSGGNSICKNSGTIMSVDNDVYTEICSAGDWKGANCVGVGCIDDGSGQNVNYECVTASDCNLNAGECGQVACINNICITQAKSDAKQVCEGIASSKGFECAAYLKCDNKIGVGYNCNFIGQSTLCGQKGFGFDTGCSDKPDFKCNQALCLDPVQNPCKLCYSQCLEAANDPNRQPVSSEECEPPNGYWALCGG